MLIRKPHRGPPDQGGLVAKILCQLLAIFPFVRVSPSFPNLAKLCKALWNNCSLSKKSKHDESNYNGWTLIQSGQRYNEMVCKEALLCLMPLCKFPGLIRLTVLHLILQFTIVQGSLLSSGIGGHHIDIIESLQLWNTSYPGLTVIRGVSPVAPAVFLQGDSRNIRVPYHVQRVAASILSGVKDLTIMATIQQEEKNAGTILSFSRGKDRFLELQSSGRKNEIRLHYVYAGGVHVEVFPYRLADRQWHKVAVVISGNQVEVWVDCIRVYQRLAPPPVIDFSKFNLNRQFLQQEDQELMTISEITDDTDEPIFLYLGQRNAGDFLFKGALQEVRVVAGPGGHRMQCPQAESQCPTCGAFQKLTETIDSLQSQLSQLTRQIASQGMRISELEDCNCRKSCAVNGTVRSDGATWKNGCEICSCAQGEVSCRPAPCRKPRCQNPVLNEGECCPVCLKQCALKGVVYDHGETMSPTQCVDCECIDGQMQCRRIDPEQVCPPLTCPAEEQFQVPGECCKACPGLDYCSRSNNCHANATCINLQTTYMCQCKPGFTGDGQACNDIDECEAVGAHHGHYCQANTTCVNTVGSYTCECPEGFIRQDEYTCLPHDECQTGSHQCHMNARCIDTSNGYTCECRKGYEGNGTNCTPKCEENCVNGGVCTSPGLCTCRLGFTGNRCELDVDECSLGLHKCESNSRCINQPGWYSCKCAPGYTSLTSSRESATHCQDIDECHLGTDTCHPTAACVNTEGSFECESNNVTENSQNCVIGKKEYVNNDMWTPDDTKCSQCVCRQGKVVCDRIVCDCNDPHSDPICCPQCDPNTSCNHPAKSDNTYQSGQKWIDQCQTCECLHGEVDCWPIECPPVLCQNPVMHPGDCCARCDDDPCSLQRNAEAILHNETTPSHKLLQPCHIIVDLSHALYWSEFITEMGTDKCQMPYCAQLIGRSDTDIFRPHLHLMLFMLLVVMIHAGITEKAAFNPLQNYHILINSTQTKYIYISNVKAHINCATSKGQNHDTPECSTVDECLFTSLQKSYNKETFISIPKATR